MTYFLSSDNRTASDEAVTSAIEAHQPSDIADIKIFWGPEICRLEYLIHLLDTGRVIDEHWPRSA